MIKTVPAIPGGMSGVVFAPVSSASDDLAEVSRQLRVSGHAAASKRIANIACRVRFMEAQLDSIAESACDDEQQKAEDERQDRIAEALGRELARPGSNVTLFRSA